MYLSCTICETLHLVGYHQVKDLFFASNNYVIEKAHTCIQRHTNNSQISIFSTEVYGFLVLRFGWEKQNQIKTGWSMETHFEKY